MTEQPTGAAEDAAALAGVPDGFARLWVPHRQAYIGGENRPETTGAGAGCPFCRAPQLSDEDGLVVARGRSAYVLMNLYPYNGGHLLVCPYRHVADYPDLTDEELTEVAHLTQAAMQALQTVSAPAGFNLGMNQGDVAGAGIAGHLHQHVVPRWAGDANFLPIVGRTRALPELLSDTRAKVAAAWPDTPATDRAPTPGQVG